MHDIRAKRPGTSRIAAYGCALLLAGLSALAGAQQLSLRYYTTTEGLGNLAINALAQEPGGALWIGTENGLYRHDGETIRRPPEGSPDSIIHSMVFGADGTLWFGSREGLFRRGATGFVPVAGELGAGWSVSKGQTLAALPNGGLLAVGVDGALWRVAAPDKDARLVPALPAALLPAQARGLDVLSILVARDGAWWFGCGGALCRWHESRLERWTEADGVPPGAWLGLLEASDGAIWARSYRRVVRRAVGAARFDDVTPKGLSRALWSPLNEDRAGRVLTAGDSGVLRWHAGRWQHFGERNGLAGYGPRSMLTDRDGGMWLGTMGRGLVHWRGYDNWSSWTVAQGLPADVVWSIADDGAGRVWIGTARGVASIGHAGTQLVNEAPALTSQVGHMAADGSGGMWVSTVDRQLFHRARGAPWREKTGAHVRRLLAVNDTLWIIAGDRGLYSTPLDGSGRVRRHDELDRLVTGSDRRINAACREPGSATIWVGTGSGLVQYDAARGFTRAQVEGLAPGKGISYLACGAGRVWLRTAIGKQLMRIDLTRNAALRAKLVAPAALKGRLVFSLLEDRRGWLWIGTDAGVVRWNGKGWRRFEASNGLVWNDCDQNALAEDSHGAIWVGTSGGVTRIADPERLGSAQALTLELTEARLGKVHLVPGRRVSIPWSTQPLELRWEVPLFTNRLAQRTRYRLHGREDGWTDIPRSELRYAGLGPGSYQLELVAINDDLEQSSPPLLLDFDIAPPWWRSPAVLAAASAAALLLVYAGYRVRIRRLVRRQNELECLVLERTRELAESHERMRELAFTDGLTGAMNRRAILDQAARELARLRRHGGALTLVLLDLDFFKRVNDTHGHPAGDALLRGLVQRLRALVRDGDCIGRYGGEEFLLVLPGLSLDEPGAIERVDRWRCAVAEQPFDVGAAAPLTATCSMGAVSVAAADETMESLIARADAALYRAKAAGRNRVDAGT